MRTKLDGPEAVDGIARAVGVRKRIGKTDTTYDGGCSCGFRSTGWAKRGHAETRIQEHLAEHETGEAPPELVDFLTGQGLTLGAPALDPFDGEKD